MLFARLLNHLMRTGTLTVVDAGGRSHTFQGADGPALTVRLHDHAVQRRLFFNPEVALGEAYMDGTLTVEDGSVYDLLDLVGRNLEVAGWHPAVHLMEWIGRLLRRAHQYNPIRRAHANAAYHYDISGALYDLFLDADRQYSCAYFATGGEDLEKAQHDKKRHIAAKLLIEPGQRVLDIGCGWGGLALYLARGAGARVTGLTLSSEQLKVAEARARDAGLADQVRFFLRDYREQTGTFDRIVSVGMFEHVGVGHYRRFFDQVHRLLTDDGVALLHTIGRADGPGATSPWTRKYIFPGSYCPALSEVMVRVEKADLWATDIEILRLHYAETLRHWRQRFLANREKAAALYDERFCRMWEFYLATAEISFRYLRSVVFQLQLTKRQEAVPLTRDYVTDFERAGAKGSDGSRHAA